MFKQRSRSFLGRKTIFFPPSAQISFALSFSLDLMVIVDEEINEDRMIYGENCLHQFIVLRCEEAHDEYVDFP